MEGGKKTKERKREKKGEGEEGVAAVLFVILKECDLSNMYFKGGELVERKARSER